jgi:hypothetical protein
MAVATPAGQFLKQRHLWSAHGGTSIALDKLDLEQNHSLKNAEESNGY